MEEITKMTLDEMKESSDWDQAFAYSPVPMDKVKAIIASENGDNDGPDWLGLFLLTDDTYLVLSAWCDYTGWDCQSGGKGEAFPSELLAIQYLDDAQRDRLGLKMVY
jgi:hypothetical protein